MAITFLETDLYRGLANARGGKAVVSRKGGKGLPAGLCLEYKTDRFRLKELDRVAVPVGNMDKGYRLVPARVCQNRQEYLGKYCHQERGTELLEGDQCRSYLFQG